MRNRILRQPQISHARFVVLFPALLYAACNAINIGRLAKWFQGTGGLDYVALAAHLAAGLCLLVVFFALLAHRWTIKPLAILLVVLSAPATYFVAKYGVAIDTSMVLNALHTDATEIKQLLSLQMIPYAMFLLAVPVAVVAAVHITFEPPRRYLVASSRIIAVALVIAGACLYLQYNAILRAANVSRKYTIHSLVPINVLSGTLTVLSRQLRRYAQSRGEEIAISGHIATPDDLVVVLAIGESSRRENFGVYGYDRRNTTPVLQTTSGLHLLDGIATRGSTLYALPRILEKRGVKLTTLVSRVGVPTACLVNYTLYDNCSFVGETRPTRCRHGGRCYDEDVIPLLERDLGRYVSGYRFVVLHLGGGSHGPVYSDRHPPEFQRFKPTCTDADVANRCTLEQLVNSYDNTILYVDHVVGSIIGTLDRSGVPYAFIYLSDHGESLMEEGRMFHGMPPGIPLPPEQARIPLIVKSSVPLSVVPRAEYRQEDVFDTVLELFSIQTPAFETPGAFLLKHTEPVPAAAGNAGARTN